MHWDTLNYKKMHLGGLADAKVFIKNDLYTPVSRLGLFLCVTVFRLGIMTIILYLWAHSYTFIMAFRWNLISHCSCAHQIHHRSRHCRHRAVALPRRPRCHTSPFLLNSFPQGAVLMIQEREKNIKTIVIVISLLWERAGTPHEWAIMTDLQGRAQSRNSSWSMATSPLWPTERCEWRRIWKAEGIRPRKMRASFQARILEASGRQTTASPPSG